MAKDKIIKPVKKQKIWLSHYLNPDGKGFMNATESAMLADYKANSYGAFGVIGCENLKKLKPLISAWMDEEGLSDDMLKKKHLKLISAQESKFIKIKGAVKQEDLPGGCRVITTSGVIETKKDSEGDEEQVYGIGETIVEIKGDALAIQAKVLDMGYRIKGSYAAEEIKLTGLEALAGKLTAARNRKDGKE